MVRSSDFRSSDSRSGDSRRSDFLAPAALLVLAAIAAFVVAMRFETAVHPDELSFPELGAKFAQDCRKLPALGSLRIHSNDPDAARKLRALQLPGGYDYLTVVADVSVGLRKGSLAMWDRDRLRTLRRALDEGEVPTDLPRIPEVLPYFRDALGPFDFELFLRDPKHVPLVQRALPDAVLTGEPVEWGREENMRSDISRAALAVVLSVAVIGLLARKFRNAEQRLLAMLAPLAVLSWNGLGVDVWTIPALALVATARSGVPLLGAVAFLFSPALSIQRLGIVLFAGGVLRLRRLPVGSRARPSPASVALVLIVAVGVDFLVRINSGLAVKHMVQLVRNEPAAEFMPAAEFERRVRRGVGKGVVGAARFPPRQAPLTTRQELGNVYQSAALSALLADGAEREQLERIRDAASRDFVHLPRGLRMRRTTRDGESVLWHPMTGTIRGRWRTLSSHQIYRSASFALLNEAAGRTGVIAAFLALLFSLFRFDISVRRMLLGVAALAAVSVYMGGLSPAYPLLMIAAVSAPFVFSLVAGVGALFLGAAFWSAAWPLALTPLVAWVLRTRPGRGVSAPNR